jgi:hypothetical protein
MAMVANDPAAAKRTGIPQSVGKEFTLADKGKKFSSGTRADSQVANQPKTNHGEKALFKQGGMTMATKKLPPFMGKETKAEEAKEMKIKAISPKMYKAAEKAEGVHKMAKGGISSSLKAHAAAPASKAHAGMRAGGSIGTTKMGGVKTAGPKPDGVVSKGKTKGKMIAMPGGKGMKSGGMSKKYC